MTTDTLKKQEAWNKIKQELDMNIPFRQEFFRLIDAHLDQVVFVKDHIGVRDFLFFAEDGTDYTAQVFSSFDTDVEPEMEMVAQAELFHEKYEEDPVEVYKQLKQLFEETSRTVCVGIGFKESCVTEDQEYKTIIGLRDGTYSSVEEGLKELRRFPAWYAEIAKMPEDVFFTTRSAERETVMEHIDRILDLPNPTTEDKAYFVTLSKRYRALKKNP